MQPFGDIFRKAKNAKMRKQTQRLRKRTQRQET
jgi:hypothetical protein